MARHQTLLLTVALCNLFGCGPVDAPKRTAVESKSSTREINSSLAVNQIEALGAKLRRDGNDAVIEVDFRNTDLGDEDLVLLSSFPQLRSVLLAGTNIGNAGLSTLGNITTLENLDLRECPISDDGVLHLRSLGKMKALKLSGKTGKCAVSESSMATIGELSNLKVLAIDYLPVGDSGIRKLVKNDKLEELYAARTGIGNSGVESIAELDQLRKLRLAQNEMESIAIQSLSRLDKLEEVDLSECSHLNDEVTVLLSKLKQLKKLNLWSVKITDAGMDSLGQIDSLESLNLDNTAISDAGLPPLGKLRQLTFLHLGSTSISDAGLPYLETLTNLQELMVTRTAVTQQGVEKLQAKLPGTKIQLQFEG